MKDRTVARSIAIVLILLALWMLWGNLSIAVTRYDAASPKLPEAFDDYRIVQVSDLHNAEFGKNNRRLLRKIKKAEPDIIVITGDMIDSHHTDEDAVLRFLAQTVELAPCYYASGNHEAWISEDLRKDLEAKMQAIGVRLLLDSGCLIERGDSSIELFGLRDNATLSVESMLPADQIGDPYFFRILLSHRPQYFDYYVASGVDLVLSGHMHGGQFRLPFVGGLIGSDTELFPEYDAGTFLENGTLMIVSRGLGNSVIPIRFNNRPELVLVVMHCK